MKIAFLCGSLEPGRNGVGDYTRHLAGACIREGHECLMISLQDKQATAAGGGTALEELQEVPGMAAGAGVTALRLSPGLPWSERARRAGERLARFKPDVVSLQFVPYAFHGRGIVLPGTAQHLKSLLTAAPCRHIMFHETWIGEGLTEPLIHRMTRVLQRLGVRNLLAVSRPHRIHTSNAEYQERLLRLRLGGMPQPRLLPLFGNIPVQQERADSWLFPRLQTEAGLTISAETRERFRIGGFFGSMFPEWRPEPLFSQLQEVEAATGRRTVLLSIGRRGGAGEALWRSVRETYADRFVFLDLGEQPAEAISQYLNSLDFAITPTPLSLVGKSGTVAAMLDHGLPVIVTRVDAPWSPPGGTEAKSGEDRLRELIYPMDETIKDKMAAGALLRYPAIARLNEVAGTFLRDCSHPGAEEMPRSADHPAESATAPEVGARQ